MAQLFPGQGGVNGQQIVFSEWLQRMLIPCAIAPLVEGVAG
ncbi:hypothetical protein PQR02_15090 [Paraburkholderia sediminicola]|uniref:Uncharacterized protein n=1 Tax=Paraburkholderia rhynchosiae TaxID=487049 RepID=A0ACC7NEV9_9BURK